MSSIKIPLISTVTTIYNMETECWLKQRELHGRNPNFQGPWNNALAPKGSAAHRDGDAVVTKARIFNF